MRIVAAMKSRMEKMCRLLGENVKAARLAMGISQEELAFRAELDRTYISQIERGIGNPSLGVLLKISTVLGAEIAELLSKQNKIA
jgi:transcriptional regulator with XRE-family HTH domain